MKTLFSHIKQLIQVRDSTVPVAGVDLAHLPIIEDAYLVIEDGVIFDYGKMDDLPELAIEEHIDVTGRIICPSWCDSHTHLVYAGNRVDEYVARIKGKSYKEIADAGGGILNSAILLQHTSEEDLLASARSRLNEILKLGTGAIEVKSGYGLTPDAEIKMLEVIALLKSEYDLPIKSTFLAGHALPAAYKNDKSGFLDSMLQDALPQIADRKLADYIDVFCEEGYFDVSDTEHILQEGLKYGLRGKIHVNQFNVIGGIKAAVKHHAVSVDHLEELEDSDLDALQGSGTIPVALPGCSHFLKIPYTPARKIIDRGLPIALASDYNPGSCPSGNMNFAVGLACTHMQMTPEEAINAATINGAHAMEINNEVGSIARGKKANFFITKPISSYAEIPYSFSTSVIDACFIDGKEIL